VDKVFGGPIIPTLIRLAILSFIVGLVLFFLGIDPVDLWRNFGETIKEIWARVGEAIDWSAKYAILGAIVVLPIWIIYRLVVYVTRPKS
jgi:hypothetical protein